MTAPAPPDPVALLALACMAARKAGELLAGHRGRPVVVGTKTSSTDVVTEMDQAAEQMIRNLILAERPGDAILGEEGGQTGAGAPVRWIVDPLDGTVNYLYGLPDWAVSIAAEAGGTVVAGAVCVPRRNALFGAVLGMGAWRAPAGGSGPPESGGIPPGSTASPRVGMAGGSGGSSPRVGAELAGAVRAADFVPAPDEREPLACNAHVPLSRALIATGFGYDPGRRRVQGQVIGAVLPRVRDIRRNGACSVDLCSLAAGNVDGYFERGVQYWDIAAGALIAREAGAVVAGLAGKPAGESMTVGAGPGLFPQLHDLLLSLDPERDG